MQKCAFGTSIQWLISRGAAPKAAVPLSTKKRHSRVDSLASKSVIRKDEPASEVGKRGKGRERPIVGLTGSMGRYFRPVTDVLS